MHHMFNRRLSQYRYLKCTISSTEGCPNTDILDTPYAKNKETNFQSSLTQATGWTHWARWPLVDITNIIEHLIPLSYSVESHGTKHFQDHRWNSHRALRHAWKRGGVVYLKYMFDYRSIKFAPTLLGFLGFLGFNRGCRFWPIFMPAKSSKDVISSSTGLSPRIVPVLAGGNETSQVPC